MSDTHTHTHTHTHLHHPQQVVIPKWQNRQSGVVKGMLTTLDGGSYTSPLVTLAPRVTVITWEAHLVGSCFSDHPFVAGAEGRAGEQRRWLNGKESGLFSVEGQTVLQVVTGRAVNTKLLG